MHPLKGARCAGARRNLRCVQMCVCVHTKRASERMHASSSELLYRRRDEDSYADFSRLRAKSLPANRRLRYPRRSTRHCRDRRFDRWSGRARLTATSLPLLLRSRRFQDARALLRCHTYRPCKTSPLIFPTAVSPIRIFTSGSLVQPTVYLSLDARLRCSTPVSLYARLLVARGDGGAASLGQGSLIYCRAGGKVSLARLYRTLDLARSR